MWCRQCQQDVPVSRSMTGAAACPRCRAPLKALAQTPTDAGLELGSFDPPLIPAAPIRKPWELDSSAADLRRIGRRLRPHYSPEAIDEPAFASELASDPPTQIFTAPATDDECASRRMLGPGLAVDLGLLSLIGGGAAMLVRTQAPIAPQLWQWGLAGVAGGAALVVCGLVWQVVGAVAQNRRLRQEVLALRAQVKELKTAASQQVDGASFSPGLRPGVDSRTGLPRPAAGNPRPEAGAERIGRPTRVSSRVA